ncbi:MAG: hypothetical protein A3A24_00610 [Candidatus Buchananbacteria bacterium RIFCSPLOWO2_01_FULL_46_12]|uniref:Uncharacterized protein n=1 Tax=Candidatus Buchananbacteria bacterium RIFCSPLOWO2_01_FULL_46_12 TaxID=1797546 RepID=A0A1G1YQ64_9BACT|nr:MAG: hypothetical protein A3A24_00610 [Candidatus Buchananbacteria bacterium RIFCSPLOWO2_01_FULL_46_12]
MDASKLFPKQATKQCPSWVCKGEERVFERVDNASVEHPIFALGELRIGPAPIRLPYAQENPSPLGRCLTCGATLFIGPTFEEVDRYVKRQNQRVEQKVRREDERSARDLIDALEDSSESIPGRARRVSRAASALVFRRRVVHAKKAS